ncbi:MAG TPA: hypothetical protein VK403_11190 [Allosphingosinicella sp.]|nr:hypothetical protein [Allosphingosinicella sp.]
MPPAAFLALLTIAMLLLAALRLELNFRRSEKDRPGSEPQAPGPGPELARPELRAAPAGGYCQAPLSPAFGRNRTPPQARRAGFAL